MKRILLLICIGAGVYKACSYWEERKAVRQYLEFEASLPKDRPESQAGFADAVQPDGTDPRIVTVLMPVGCPMEAGRRGRALLDKIRAANIPVEALSNARVTIKARSKAEFDAKMERVNKVMGGETPIVFFKGRAKDNPSFEDVLLEFRTSQ
jgi:hypothetical protein